MSTVERPEPLQALLEELEHNMQAWDRVGLYEFSWILRGLDRGLTGAEIAPICQQAFDEFTARHPTRVVWSKWPIDLTSTWPVEPGTPLAFDLDPEGSVDEPLQVLIPDQATST